MHEPYRSDYAASHRPPDTTVVVIAYLLHLVGAILGLPSVIALIINYVKRHDGPPLADNHHAWMIRTFWWAVLWSIIGGILWFFIIGMAILGLAWLWYLYRHIRGLLNLFDGRPMPA